MLLTTKVPISALLATLTGLTLCEAAETRRALQADVNVSTDYIFRGYSWSDSAPVFQAGLSYRHRTGFFLGIWGSTVDFEVDAMVGRERRAEIRALAGYGRTVGQSWSWRTLMVHYEFPNAHERLNTSYTEAQFSGQYRDLFAATVAYTRDFLGSDIPGLFVELSGSYPLPQNFRVSAGVGLADFDLSLLDYYYGHVAAGWTIGHFSLELGYFDAGGRPFPLWGEVADGTWVLNASARFP